MASVRIAKPAKSDLRAIGRYTRGRWNRAQARRYLGELDACFHRLAENPQLGRSAESVRPGLWRIEQGRHVIFYRRTADGIRVIRILHDRMLPPLHIGPWHEDDS